jgi:hypothetical protein
MRNQKFNLIKKRLVKLIILKYTQKFDVVKDKFN